MELGGMFVTSRDETSSPWWGSSYASGHGLLCLLWTRRPRPISLVPYYRIPEVARRRQSRQHPGSLTAQARSPR